ncbi:hypothetical protein DID75_02635 [Candidatus Marinamargulisbacteria bacterium SCGC AG-410-N11]|nr:hypothetical protein DID75_02635 [Candidatus Marinamargulisbacteria bacterium SCGC AG-410-N11]
MDYIIFKNIFYIIETIGIFSFALSGLILAKQKNFDLVGVYIVACVTAFGGGTIRDVILDIQPVYWISHSEYPTTLLITVFIICLFKKFSIKEKWLFLPDALGLSLFTVTTAQMAYEANLPIIVVAILSTIVASFGGVIRDVLCQQIPIIFQRNTPIYASLAFLGAIFYVLLTDFTPFPMDINMIICSFFIFSARLIVKRFHIVLPI